MKHTVKTKKCSKCKEEKTSTKFYPHKEYKDKLRPECKRCSKLAIKQYYKLNREARVSYSVKWAKENRTAHLLKKRIYKLRKYGLTIDEYDKVVTFQQGLCAICKLPFKKRNIDHNHHTGETRGILCWFCNGVLGKFKDDPKLFEVICKNAMEYLVNPPVKQVCGEAKYSLPGRITTSIKRRKMLAKKSGIPIEKYYFACSDLMGECGQGKTKKRTTKK